MGAGATGSSAHLGEVGIELLPSEERDIGSEEIARRVRETLGEVAGPESITFRSSLFSAGNEQRQRVPIGDGHNLAGQLGRSYELRGK